jgi:hypothetical protein
MINDTPNIIRPTNKKVFGFISLFSSPSHTFLLLISPSSFIQHNLILIYLGSLLGVHECICIYWQIGYGWGGIYMGSESPPARLPEDKENASVRKKLQTVIIGILAILAVIVFAYIFAALYDGRGTKQQQTMIIVNDVIDTPANYYMYSTFSVPADASTARVTGNYEVHGGLIPRINIYLADASRCSSPIESSSYYYIGEGKSFGKVDVYLPTRSQETTYYLVFENIAPLGESKQTEASFKLEIS